MKKLNNFLLLILAFVTLTAFDHQDYDYKNLKKSDEIFDSIDDAILNAIVGNDSTRTNIRNFVRKDYRLNNAPVVRNKTAPFLLRIESSYYDEGVKEWRTVQGLGTLVRISVSGTEYSAALSVSHLTQGQRLRIFDNLGRSLPILPGQRLANIDDDVELILLKDKLETPLKYNETLHIFVSPYLELGDGVVPDNYEVTDYDRVYVAKKQHVPILQSMLPKNSKGQDRVSFEMDREMVIQKLARKGLRRKDLFTAVWNQDGILQKQFLGHGYIANARMLPGLSGAPLIRDIPHSAWLDNNIYNYSIEGLVQGHHRFENKSYFVGEKSISNVSTAFLSGKRNYTSNTRWRLRDGMTFRDYGNGVLETNIVKTPSSSFFKGDSGNSISVDGYRGSGQSEMGMQNGYNSKVVGRFVKTQGKIIPVVADPQMDQFLPKDFEKLQTFGAEQDLLKLAMMKYQLRDQFTNQIDLYDCFYRVSDRGIDLKLESKSKVLLQMHRSPEELRGGVRKNKLVVDGGSQSPSIEISGLFFTDLSSIPSTDEILTSGSPTVTVFPFKGVDSQRVNCFKDKAERNEVINKMEQDFRNRTQEI